MTTLALRYAARSDRGLVRANNEDSVYAGARLLALADGMGGHAAGEVASQLVIAALAHLDEDEPRGDLLGQLNDAVHQGNAAIAGQVESDPELDGMGTTLTAILFAGNRLGLVHIGDSRGYLLRDGELTQITKDDTFVQTLVDEGRITAEEAHSHPQRSLIMRALTGHEVEPTLIMREAFVGDRYLLCSDGLSDPVSFDTIQESLLIPDVEASADRLIEMALRGGGPDNVTVVVADVIDFAGIAQTQPILAGAVSGDDDQSAPPNTAAGRASAFNPRRTAPAKRPVAEPEPPPRKKRSRRTLIIAAVLLVLLLIAGLALARFVIQTNYYVAKQDNNEIYVMRGVQGSIPIVGTSLADPFAVACLAEKNELKIIGVDDDRSGCRPLKVDYLDESGQRALTALPKSGNFEDASNSLKQLVRSLLPVCGPPPPAKQPVPLPPTPAPQAPPTENTAAPGPDNPLPETPVSVPPTQPEAPPTASTPQPKTQAPAPPGQPTTSATAVPTASPTPTPSPAPEQKPADKPCRVAA
jgi:serine/threonine protein phosphatase PrpC